MTDWLTVFAAHCSKNIFLGFPNWSKGLDFKHDGRGGCVLADFSLGDIWIVAANVTRMVLFLAGLLAVVFIIIGGIMYITSSGDPERTGRAKKILTNAVMGLIIAIFASTLVGYIAGLF